MKPVYITRLAQYLPNTPVANEEMEEVLGMVNGKPSKARSIVLRSNGIQTRYYAFRNGASTHTNAQLAALAIKGLFDEKIPIEQLELLACGTGSPDQLLPSHAAMVHGELGIQPLELVSAAGSCCSSIQSMKYAFMAIACGLVHTAACSGSEKPSSWMHASRFQAEAESLPQLNANPYIAFEKDFLRWMLSDGAAAALLQSVPNKESISLKVEWIEIISYASELETCMYAGGIKNGNASLTSWNDLPVHTWTEQSVFSLKQDTRILSEHVVPYGGKHLQQLMHKYQLSSDQIDYYLPHMSSEFFKKQIRENLQRIGLAIPDEKWFYNLPQVGNVGSASPFLMLEELFHSGRLQKGQRLLVMVPESARFSYAYLYLTVV